MYPYRPLHHQPGYFVTNVEAAISRSGASEKLAAKAQINFIGAVRHAKVPPCNIPPKEMKALRDLVTDDDILVLPGDKGKALW